jgi:hypothetical protein
MTSYPELKKLDPGKLTYISLEQAAGKLKNLPDQCLAKAIFAVMYIEAGRTDDRKFFKSAGHFNYGGIQTDSGRWKNDKNFVGRFSKPDVSGNVREFAAFKNHEDFFNFMADRLKAKGFNGCNAYQWTDTYIQKWWSPAAKAQYKKGSKKYQDKKNVYNGAIKRYEAAPKITMKKRINKKLLLIPLILFAAVYLNKKK